MVMVVLVLLVKVMIVVVVTDGGTGCNPGNDSEGVLWGGGQAGHLHRALNS